MGMTKIEKDAVLFVRISSEEKAELDGLAARLDRSTSQIVREAVRQTIAKLKADEAAEPATA
jgi:predicted transcriptional regulator